MSRDSLLVISTSFPQAGDGSEAAGSFVADFVAAISSHIPVRVVAPGAIESVDQMPDGVAVHRFASPGRPLSLLSPSRPSDWPAIASTLASLRRQTLAADHDARLAHTLALWALPSGWAARQLKGRSGVPYSVWALGSDIWTLGAIPGVRSVLRSVVRGASFRFADGLQLGEEAAALTARPFEFLPSSRKLVAHRHRPISSGPPYRLVFLGRWHPNKGIDLLLEALDRLPESAWQLISEVHIAGGGPMERQVREWVFALMEKGRPIRLDGYLDKPDASLALAGADFLLLPSRIESIPVVFSDAMKMRLPVISMPVGDLPRLIFRGNGAGVVAAAVSSESFAEAIIKCLGTPPSSMQVEIQELDAIFDVDSAAKSFVERLALA